jgi:hypothetical protein
MDPTRFDDALRAWARARTRRALLARAAAAAGAAALTAVGLRPAAPAAAAVVEGDCAAFAAALRQGVDGHPGHPGWTTATYRFDVSPTNPQVKDAPSQDGKVCRTTQPVTIAFSVATRVSVLSWKPTGPTSAECLAEKQRVEGTIVAHENHHVQDAEEALKEVLQEQGLAGTTTRAFSACAKKKADADAKIARDFAAALAAARAARKAMEARFEQKSDQFHASPGGAPVRTIDCSKCCPPGGRATAQDGAQCCAGPRCPQPGTDDERCCRYADGACCENGRCCPSTHVCVGGGQGCCPAEQPQPCPGRTCCEAEATCCGGLCCPATATCWPNGACCPNGTRPCPDGGCCPQGTTCVAAGCRRAGAAEAALRPRAVPAAPRAAAS